MGDLIAPKRSDVFDRLRRRIKEYRQRQSTLGSHYEPHFLGLFDQQRRDSELLRQRWLASKAKRAAKVKKDNNHDNRQLLAVSFVTLQRVLQL